MSKIINILLRFSTMGCRFVLVFFLAKFLTSSEMGMYGLVVATVSYLLYLVGMDFYTYATREMVALNRSEWGRVIKTQIIVAGVMYVLVLPLVLLLFYRGIMPWSMVYWVIFLLIVEHLCQESWRILIVAGEQLYSSVLLFLRQGLWAILLVGLMYLEPGYRELNGVLLGWLLSAGVAMVIGFVKFHHMDLGGWNSSVDWRWVRRGIKVCIPLFVATMAYRLIYTADRFMLENHMDLSMVGVYVVYMGIAGALTMLLDAGVFSYHYPALIRSHHEGDRGMFRRLYRRMMMHVVMVSVLFAIFSSLIVPYLVSWLGKGEYIENIDIYYWLLAGMIFAGFAMVPHYGLYAMKKDSGIVYSHIVGASAFFVAVYFGFLFDLKQVIPVGVFVSQFVIFLWKLAAFRMSNQASLIAGGVHHVVK